MDITIVLASKNEKEILRNLLEKYLYEFSQYDDADVNDIGFYGYDYLDYYWTENNENRFAYFIKVDKKLAGFFMIREHTNYEMAEFFVMNKYRRLGVGTYVMKFIFNKYTGKWQIGYTPRNKIAKIFWNKIVEKYTNGKYTLVKDNPKHKYKDNTLGEELIFEIK